MTTFYEHKAQQLQGGMMSMSEYKDKVILVVNTASKCGFTSQYEGLERLYKDYKEKGFVILGFPCNQFANQEPGDEESIAQGCVINYGVTFPMFAKIDVNGKHAHPLFSFLKQQKKGVINNAIKWNFTKFLIDRKGIPVERFAPITTPEQIRSAIEELL